MEQELVDRAKRQAGMCRILGNPCRLMILWSLAQGELAVGEIADAVGSSLQNVSQHLRLLRKQELITSRRDGQHIYYRMQEHAWLECCLAITGANGKTRIDQQSISIPGGIR